MPPLPAGAGAVLPLSRDQLLHWLAYKEAGALLQLVRYDRPKGLARRVAEPIAEAETAGKS